jgi:fructosamine-3-kinase
MVQKNIESEVISLLSTRYGEGVEVISSKPLSGGSINQAWRLETTAGGFFLKHNLADRYSSMF